MDNFDLKTAENNAADKRYDEIPVFKQGIAIVRRDSISANVYDE